MDCLFCKIIQRDIPANIVFENEHILAFRDIHPQSPDHVLIIPKQHIPSLSHAIDDDEQLLGKLMLIARSIAQDLGHFSKGYRIVLNTGEYGGQTVHHIHLHLLAGKPMGWPPG